MNLLNAPMDLVLLSKLAGIIVIGGFVIAASGLIVVGVFKYMIYKIKNSNSDE